MKPASIVLIGCLGLIGCERPDVLIDSPPTSIDIGEPPADNWQPSFALIDASMSIGGEETGARINLRDDTFTYLFIYVDEVGLFMISTEPFGPTKEAGAFLGNSLLVEYDGVTIEIVSRAGILSEPENRPAWVEFIPNFQMFEVGTRPANVVIGLADNRNQIPGFDRPPNPS